MVRHVIVEGVHVLLAAVGAGGGQELLQGGVHGEALGAVLAVVLLGEQVGPEVGGEVGDGIGVLGDVPGGGIVLVGLPEGAVIAADLHVDAGLHQHRLERLIGALGRLGGDQQADVQLAGLIAGVGQVLGGLLGIPGEVFAGVPLLHVVGGHVGGHVVADDAGGGAAAHQHGHAVEAVGDGLADVLVLAGGVLAGVEDQVLGHEVVVVGDVVVVVALEAGHVGGADLGHVNLAVLQGDGAHGGLGDAADDDLIGVLQLDSREVLALPVVGAGGHGDGGGGLHAGHGVGAGGGGVALHLVLGSALVPGLAGDGAVAQDLLDGALGVVLQVDGQVGVVNGLGVVVVQADLGDVAQLGQRVIAEHHVGGGDGVALAVGDALVDLHLIGGGVHLGHSLGGDHLQLVLLKRRAHEGTVAQVGPQHGLGPVADGAVAAPGADGEGVVVHGDGGRVALGHGRADQGQRHQQRQDQGKGAFHAGFLLLLFSGFRMA